MGLKSQREVPRRLIVPEPSILVVFEGLQPANDLLHRHFTTAADLDFFVEALKFGCARPLEAEKDNLRRIVDDDNEVSVFSDPRHRAELARLQIDQFGCTKLLVGKDQSKTLVIRRLLGHHPEPEVFTNKGPRSAASGRIRVWVVDHPAAELSSRHLERSQINRDSSIGLDKGDGRSGRGPIGYLAYRSRQLLRPTNGIHRHRLPRIELRQDLHGRRRCPTGSEHQDVEIGSNLLEIQPLEGTSIGGQRTGRETGPHRRSRHHHRGPLDQVAVVGGGQCTGLGTPDRLDEDIVTGRLCDLCQLSKFTFEPAEVFDKRRRGCKHNPQPRFGAGGTDRIDGIDVGSAIEGNRPADEEELFFADSWLGGEVIENRLRVTDSDTCRDRPRELGGPDEAGGQDHDCGKHCPELMWFHCFPASRR